MSRLIDADLISPSDMLIAMADYTQEDVDKVHILQGAVYGMQKLLNAQPTVDQWHYPSKGERPPRTGEYLVYFHTMTGYYTDVRELNPKLNNLTYGVGEWVVAWQEIIPPKEEV